LRAAAVPRVCSVARNPCQLCLSGWAPRGPGRSGVRRCCVR
jgi:hypothetical protein